MTTTKTDSNKQFYKLKTLVTMKANIFTETAANIWANVKYYFEGLRLAKYGPMYKDEAEAGREVIERLQAENRLLREQYARQSELVRTLAAGK